MKKLFLKYINSNCTPQEFETITNFLRKNENDTRIFQYMQPIWQKHLNEDEELPQTNSELFGKIKDKILKEREAKISRKLNFYKIGFRIAAIFILGLFVTAYYFFQDFDQPIIAKNTQTITAPFGSKTNVDLPDGSSVCLNSGSTLSYSAAFENNRKIHLKGQAYFDVKHNKKKPFRVMTQNLVVMVHGTKFDVNAYPENDKQSIVLESGSVELRHRRGKIDKIKLEPGEMASYDAILNKMEVVDSDVQRLTSWKDGILTFLDDPMVDVINKMERWYDVDIDVVSPEVYDLVFTATVIDESLEVVFDLMKFASGINYEIKYSRDPKISTKVIIRN